jgi:hypothetical protein
VAFSIGLAVFFFLLFLCFAQISQTTPWAYYQVGFNDDWPIRAAPAIAWTACIAVVFVIARFSFGYFVGFFLFVVAAGYFWLNAFGVLAYQHETAMLSAAASIVLFLIPALMTKGGQWEGLELLPRRTPEIVLAISLALLIVCASYGVRLAGIEEMDLYRTTIVRPRWLEYLIGNACGALLPFAIAWVMVERRWLMVAALCTVVTLFYPVTLTKTSLFAIPFILFIATLSRYASPKWTVLLSLFVPLCIGQTEMVGTLLSGTNPLRYIVFSIFNIRLLAIPSISLDHYFAFFANHPLTHFCQISLLKPFMACPYNAQLGVVMADAYHLGNMNASLLATEGVASVGPALAPIVAFICGLAFGAGNICSDGLPPRFVLISGAMVAVSLLNVPLSTTILTNGYGLLLVLWFFAPRSMLATSHTRGMLCVTW